MHGLVLSQVDVQIACCDCRVGARVWWCKGLMATLCCCKTNDHADFEGSGSTTEFLGNHRVRV